MNEPLHAGRHPSRSGSPAQGRGQHFKRARPAIEPSAGILQQNHPKSNRVSEGTSRSIRMYFIQYLYFTQY